MKTVLFSTSVANSNTTRAYLIVVMDKGLTRLSAFVPYGGSVSADIWTLICLNYEGQGVDPVLQHEVVDDEYRVFIQYPSARSGFKYKVIPL